MPYPAMNGLAEGRGLKRGDVAHGWPGIDLEKSESSGGSDPVNFS